MRRVNYKSDFDFILRLRSANGEELGWPPFDWRAKFHTASRWQVFEASCTGGTCLNCYNDNGRIHIVADNHGLPPGRLCMEFVAEVPDGKYPDGAQRKVAPQPLEIELVDGCDDCYCSAAVEVVLPVVSVPSGSLPELPRITEEEIDALIGS